ncbi:MAG: response regulator [Methanothrix sp.]|jgi:two-component system response regulator|nr:response regulator [Methanothrix sp.]OPX81952.1 MAG: response regulator PleD [Methanosaeta sp. PtaB.Bin087]OPY51167.1 MAG: response regulator PleD [Methanosaeta sp. PtaU1.Bin055]HNR57907.1 response regulator [Methanothrix sp.]HNT73361.1 response regulator [Methanothrix sp.]
MSAAVREPKSSEVKVDRNHQKLKILLVEDNPDDVELTCRLLRRICLERDIFLATEAEEALKILHTLLDKGADLPDLILLDIKLPRLSGMELLERLKASPDLRGIPVVMLTGSIVSEHIQKSYDLGAVSYLLKPISEDELLLTLSYVS